MNKIAFSLLLNLGLIGILSAQPFLDASFGSGGFTEGFGLNTGSASNSVLVQEDGKILQAGEFLNPTIEAAVVVRTMPDGTLDNTFGTAGKFVFDFGGTSTRATCMALLPDGKILVGGQNENQVFVMRLLPNGQIDNTFGGVNHYYLTNFASFTLNLKQIMVQSDGKIVLAGSVFNSVDWDVYTQRIDSSGASSDITYGAGGIYQIAQNLDQELISAKMDDMNRTLVYFAYDTITTIPYKTNYFVGRIKTDGSLDNTFGNAGFYRDAILNGSTRQYGEMVLTPDEKILITGSHYNASGNFDAFICQITQNGFLDNTFNATGRLLIDYAGGHEEGFNLSLQSDGQIILGGGYDNASNDYYFLARFSPTGVPDLSFGPSGRFLVNITSQSDVANALAFQQDGKFLFSGFNINTSMMGYPTMMLARFILDEDFSVNDVQNMDATFQFYPNPASEQIIITSSETFTLQVISLEGKLISEYSVQGNHIVDVSHLSPGVYILKSRENNAWSRKLIKR